MRGSPLRQTDQERAVTMTVYKRSEESLIAFSYRPIVYRLEGERDSSLRSLILLSLRVRGRSA